MGTWLQENWENATSTFFSNFIDTISDIVFIIDTANQVVFCNKAAYEQLAIPKPFEPFLINDLLVSDSRDSFSQLINKSKQSKEKQVGEFYFVFNEITRNYSIATTPYRYDVENDIYFTTLVLFSESKRDEIQKAEIQTENILKEYVLNSEFNIISDKKPVCLYCLENLPVNKKIKSFVSLVNHEFSEIVINTLMSCYQNIQEVDCEVIMQVNNIETWVLIRFFPRKFDNKFFIEVQIIDITYRRFKIGSNTNKFHIPNSLVSIGTIFSTTNNIALAIRQSMQHVLDVIHLDSLVIYRDQPEEDCFILENKVVRNELIENDLSESTLNYSTVLGFKKILENYELIVSGSLSNSMTKSLQEKIAGIGMQSFVISPIFIAGKFYGALIAGYSKKREWTNLEIEFIHGSSLILGQNIDREITKREILSTRNDFINIFNNASDLVFIVAFNGTIIEANHTAIKALGYKRAELLGKHVENISAVSNDIEHILGGEIHQSRQLIFGTSLIKKSGENIPIEVREKIVTYNNRKCILTIARDITDRKQFDRLILQTIIETEERERKRFAESLHDDLGPLLSAMKIYVDLLVNKKIDPKANTMAMDQMKQIMEQAIVTTRQTALNIMPNVLTDFGLAEALSDFITKVRTTQIVEIEYFETNPQYIIKGNKAKVLFSVIKELTNNSLRHSGAKKVDIKLLDKTDSFVVEYSDDGIGFDFYSMLRKENRGMGIKNIVSKIESINGKIKAKQGKKRGIFIEIVLKKIGRDQS